MKLMRYLLLGILPLLTMMSARADILVLVHGYMGSANSWEQSGVNATLSSQGWHTAGLLRAGPYGHQLIPVAANPGANRVYLVDLPSIAPLLVQSDLLLGMLHDITERHPDEALIIAGHSAGGVVARASLVRGSVDNVKALITIASPHLGTARAIQALEATRGSGPFGLLKNVFGGETYRRVKESRGVLVDLTPAYPGSLLYWLNAQPHPDIAYYSVVRPGPVGMGDELVPAFSQDMNQVPSLKGRSHLVTVESEHSLNPNDGRVLLELLAGL